jgi:hypothetical protein
MEPDLVVGTNNCPTTSVQNRMDILQISAQRKGPLSECEDNSHSKKEGSHTTLEAFRVTELIKIISSLGERSVIPEP